MAERLPTGARILPFRPRTAAREGFASSPRQGERPTIVVPARSSGLLAGAILSLALHGLVYAALQARFADDLMRAAGAALAQSDGTVVVPVEIVSAEVLATAAATGAETTDVVEPHSADATRVDATTAQRIEDGVPAPAAPIESMAAPLQQDDQQDDAAPIVASEIAAEDSPALARTDRAAPAEAAAVSEPRRPAWSARERRRVSQPRQASATPSRTAAASAAGRAGAGGADEVGGSRAVSSYEARVFAHLLRHRFYPAEARSAGITGVVRVRFSLAADGRLLSTALYRGSGIAVLDDAAMAMVRRASPFPPFPAGLRRARMEFVAPVRYGLD